jgi:hypothetical protein
VLWSALCKSQGLVGAENALVFPTTDPKKDKCWPGSAIPLDGAAASVSVAMRRTLCSSAPQPQSPHPSEVLAAGCVTAVIVGLA